VVIIPKSGNHLTFKRQIRLLSFQVRNILWTKVHAVTLVTIRYRCVEPSTGKEALVDVIVDDSGHFTVS